MQNAKSKIQTAKLQSAARRAAFTQWVHGISILNFEFSVLHFALDFESDAIRATKAVS